MKFKDMFGDSRFVSFPCDYDSAVLRGEFEAGEFEYAEIIIACCGFCEVYINGDRVSRDRFVPLNTDFCERDITVWGKPFGEVMAHRMYVLKYDVTDYIMRGDNTVGFHIGPGWFAGTRDTNDLTPFGSMKLCFKIVLSGESGQSVVYRSSGDLRYSHGFVREYRLLKGEVQDFSDYSANWSENAFDCTGWKSAVEVAPVETDYLFSDCPTDITIRHLTPKLISTLPSGETVYDVGENISGYPILLSSGEPGEISVRYSEELYGNDLDSRHEYYQKDVFITGGQAQRLHTHFTWHGFRYFKISGAARPISCRVIHANIPVTSSFKSGNATLDWIYSAFIRTQLMNMHCGIPSDCPHIERRGYTGDGQLMCDTVMTLLDAKRFYKKWIRDISDCQDRLSGHVQYTAPYVHSGGGPGGWGCAIVNVPYIYYRHYGDTDILREIYPQMLRYFDYLDSHSENGLVVSDREGDWCLGDWAQDGEPLIPPPFVNTYFYIKSLSQVIEIASLIGKSADIPAMREKLEGLKATVLREYFDEASGDFCGNLQAANCFALDIGMGDERTFSRLVEYAKKTGYLETGIFATEILCRLLLERGHGDLAIKLLTSEKPHTFDEMRKRGATTIWEHWDGNRSRSHPMFGAVVNLFFTQLLGIKQKSSCGFESLEISPADIAGLSKLSGHIITPQGKLSVSYERCDGKVRFRIFVPDNTNAVFSFGSEKRYLYQGVNEFKI